MMVGDENKNKCGKRVYKAIRKYASFVNGETSLCGTPCKKFKAEEEERTVSERVIGGLHTTEDFINYVCCGFKTEMAKVFLLKDLHMPLLEGEFMSCDTPPDSLCSLKRSLQPCHVALNGIVPPSSTSLVKKENNARKTFESALAKKKKEKILNSTFPKLNNAKGVLKSRELTAEKVSRIKRDLKGSGGSERRGGQGERGLKERLRPSTKALSSAIKKEHLFKKYNSTNAAPNTPNKNINSSCNLVDKFNRKLRRAQSNGTHNNGTKHALYNEKDRVEGTEGMELIEATEEDFGNIPLFINKLCQQQQPLFHVSPPPAFKVECSVPQQTRFGTHNQYIHRLCNRWGHNSVQLACITDHLDSQRNTFTSHPLVGGVEVDLVALMEAIGSHGGLQGVIDKELWSDVIKCMHVPKTARDKVSRFYEIYCRHLLSYDTLPVREKLKLLRAVNTSMFSEHSDDLCVSKGRCRNLGELYVVARNVVSMMELEDANNKQILHRYWRVVEEASPHLTVNTAFIKSSDVSTSRRNRSFRNKLDITSMIRCCNDGLCPLFADEEVIDSRLEVEMIFSSRCWSRDQHGRGLIAYNHTGADVVWYCIRGEDEELFRCFLTQHCPNLISKKHQRHWLPANHVMVSPRRLTQAGVKVFSCTQAVGHMVIIPPSSFFSSVSCGYSVSEHAHFLPHDWLMLADEASKSLQQACVVPMFSLERFLVSLLTREVFIYDKLQHQHQQHQQPFKRHLSEQQIKQAFLLLNKAINREMRLRKLMADMGVRRAVERVLEGSGGANRGATVGSDSFMTCLMRHKLSICASSKAFCFFSKTQETPSNSVLCLECAYKRLQAGAMPCHYESTFYFVHHDMQDILSKIRKTFNLPKEVSVK